MSYDIYLTDPVTKKVLELDEPHQITGGTYAIGGTTQLRLNITYNYAKHFKPLGEKGIRTIYGMIAIYSIPVLEQLADTLKEDVTDNYWEATEGNAKSALLKLIILAKMRPNGIWDGD